MTHVEIFTTENKKLVRFFAGESYKLPAPDTRMSFLTLHPLGGLAKSHAKVLSLHTTHFSPHEKVVKIVVEDVQSERLHDENIETQSIKG